MLYIKYENGDYRQLRLASHPVAFDVTCVSPDKLHSAKLIEGGICCSITSKLIRAFAFALFGRHGIEQSAPSQAALKTNQQRPTRLFLD